MDLDNIFNIFDSFSNDEENQFNDETSLLIDFSNHPLFWISGFNKILQQHLFFKNYTIKEFGKISPDINIKELEKAGGALMFQKAWEYISNIDVNKSLHIDYLKVKASKLFIENLQITIMFYEELEEYEKCALLKGIENKVNEFLI